MVGEQTMKVQKIGTIMPYFFEDSLIIPLTKKWMNLFGTSPLFNVIIDQSRRLHLISPKMRKDYQ